MNHACDLGTRECSGGMGAGWGWSLGVMGTLASPEFGPGGWGLRRVPNPSEPQRHFQEREMLSSQTSVQLEVRTTGMKWL